MSATGGSGISNLVPQKGLVPVGGFNPSAPLYSQMPAVGKVLSGAVGAPMSSISAQNQATAQSQQTASNLQNQLNARIAQGNLAHPLSQITGQGTQNSSIAPLNTRASVATPAQLQAGNNTISGSTQAPQTNSLAPNTDSFGGLVGTVAQTASQPTPGFVQAQNDYNTAEKELQQSKEGQADQSFENLNNPIPAFAKGGRENSINSSAAFEQAAEAATMNAAANQECIQTGQQATQLGGQETAAGLVAPTPANIYGQFNPATGLVTGYNSGTAENPSTGGVATGGAIQTHAQQGSAVQTMTGTLTQAQGLASTLSDAITSAGYNPVQGIGPATTFANGVNDWLQKNSGSPQYQTVANLISEVANKYAAILNQSGGTPTSVTQVQQQIINGLASGTQIKDILANLDTNAQTSINALKSASQTNAAQGSSGDSSETTKVINGRTYTKTANGWTSS